MSDRGEEILASSQHRELFTEQKEEEQKQEELIKPDSKKPAAEEIVDSLEHRNLVNKNDKLKEREDQSLFRFARLKYLRDRFGLNLPIGTLITKLNMMVKYGVPIIGRTHSVSSSSTTDHGDNRREVEVTEYVVDTGQNDDPKKGEKNNLADSNKNSADINIGKESNIILDFVKIVAEQIVKALSLILSVFSLGSSKTDKEQREDEKLSAKELQRVNGSDLQNKDQANDINKKVEGKFTAKVSKENAAERASTNSFQDLANKHQDYTQKVSSEKELSAAQIIGNKR